MTPPVANRCLEYVCAIFRQQGPAAPPVTILLLSSNASQAFYLAATSIGTTIFRPCAKQLIAMQDQERRLWQGTASARHRPTAIAVDHLATCPTNTYPVSQTLERKLTVKTDTDPDLAGLSKLKQAHQACANKSPASWGQDEVIDPMMISIFAATLYLWRGCPAWQALHGQHPGPNAWP